MFITKEEITELFEHRFNKKVIDIVPHYVNYNLTVADTANPLPELDQFTNDQQTKGCYFGNMIVQRIAKTLAGTLIIKANTLQTGPANMVSPTLTAIYQDSMHSVFEDLSFKDLDLFYTGTDAAGVELCNINFVGFKIIFY